ncbi:hypothetical protein WPS_16300 [Vulcanimicrobium alpinum]|uniref:Uncharacterized protein n=1 Tax=Vulcanimicrobium alpinum TaxID=3016050 RepID=A0AAN1XWM7_UNVUL|nr:hypothetical protein [Vulcanimicrobium alpinum]BDE06354.1 hypothetical protein WPS_16300 [Vulcanimicrobium alpinum]
MHGTGWIVPVLLAFFALAQVLSAARKAKNRAAAAAAEPDAAPTPTLPASVLRALYAGAPNAGAAANAPAAAPSAPAQAIAATLTRPQVRFEPRRAPAPPRPAPPPQGAAVPPLLAAFADPAHARNAVVLAEILAPPVALR